MKTKILVGAVAVVLWGGAALAGEGHAKKDCPEPNASSASIGSDVDANVGVGGSGLVEDSDSSSMSTSEDVYGGSGDVSESDMPTDTQSEALSQPPAPAPSTTVIVQDDDAVAAAPVVTEAKEEKLGDTKGLTLLLGGGVEGYSGDLAPAVDPGLAWGVTAALKPTTLLGLELSYTGAANEVGFGGGNLTDGADIVRNGGEAVATIGLSPTSIQPYILGGVGINRYNVRGAEGVGGLRDDTSGNVPLGAGLRTHIGDFTADARLNYNFLFDNEFAPVGTQEVLGNDDFSNGGRYNGMLRLGTTF
jgi:hypothetical protein